MEFTSIVASNAVLILAILLLSDDITDADRERCTAALLVTVFSLFVAAAWALWRAKFDAHSNDELIVIQVFKVMRRHN